MLLPQLIALIEFVELLEREAPLLSCSQRHDRLTALHQVIARMHGKVDVDVDVDAEIDRLVLRACNIALSAMCPAAVAVEMVGSEVDAQNEKM